MGIRQSHLARELDCTRGKVSGPLLRTLLLSCPLIATILQTFIGKRRFHDWLAQRASSIQNLQLDFDAWCRQYYQGSFSAIQAGGTVADTLALLRPSLLQLKLSDTSYVVDKHVLQSIATLSQLQHLQLFGLSSHMLVSDDLSVLSQLGQLKNLELSDGDEARLTVQQQYPYFFPVQLCSLPNLVLLHIQSPLVTHIAAQVTHLCSLHTLMVNSCAIQQVPVFLSKLTGLKTLSLADNTVLALDKIVEEWWPEQLSQLTTLTYLDLSYCSMSSVPMSLSSLHQLRRLDLSANSTQPAMLLQAVLTECSSLEHLELNDLSLSTIPRSVCMMASLCRLTFVNNELHTLPDEIAALTQLQHLDLAHNSFESFPLILIQLTSLESISLEGCRQMQIPHSLDELTRLSRLTSLVLTCDLSRHEPRWSAESTSRLVSLACSIDRVRRSGMGILRF